MADHVRQELVIEALTMAVRRRRPPKGLIHHSDQGGQYVSLGFEQVCARSGISRSMGSRGDCYDNAMMESFFHTLKMEHVYWHSYRSHREAESSLFDFIELFYNPQRLHTSLGQSPADYEKKFT